MKSFGKIMVYLCLSSLCICERIEISAIFDSELNTIVYNGKSFVEIDLTAVNKQTTKLLQDNLANIQVEEEKGETISSGSLWLYIVISLALTLFAGLMSGLTVGYLSIDDLVLELKQSTGTDEEKQQAEKVLPILHENHWLLVTLLLMNAAAMETLPLILNLFMTEYMAVIVSVTLVLLFGEIIPQAVCTGPDQIKIAANIAPLTKFLMYISSPLSYPISLLLDYLLGAHTKSRFQNSDLKALIELHTHNAIRNLHMYDDTEYEKKMKEEIGLDDDQANLMISAIEMNKKLAREKMIPIEKVFMFDYSQNVHDITMLTEGGYSRIPIYEDVKDNVLGILRIKELIGVDFKNFDSIRDKDIPLRKPLVISPSMNLLELLKEFRKGKSHMAFVTEQVEEVQQQLGLNRTNSIIPNFNKNYAFKKAVDFNKKRPKLLGIITLEDVIEEMINIEIKDEDDYDKEKKALEVKAKKNNVGYSSKEISQIFTKSFLKENQEMKKFLINAKEKMSYGKSIKAELVFADDDIGTPLIDTDSYFYRSKK